MTVIPAQAGIQRGARRLCTNRFTHRRASVFRHFKSLDSRLRGKDGRDAGRKTGIHAFKGLG